MGHHTTCILRSSGCRVGGDDQCPGLCGNEGFLPAFGAQSGSVTASLGELATPRVGHRRQRVRCNNSGDRRCRAGWVEGGGEAATRSASPDPTLQNSLFSLSRGHWLEGR